MFVAILFKMEIKPGHCLPNTSPPSLPSPPWAECKLYPFPSRPVGGLPPFPPLSPIPPAHLSSVPTHTRLSLDPRPTGTCLRAGPGARQIFLLFFLLFFLRGLCTCHFLFTQIFTFRQLQGSLTTPLPRGLPGHSV